MDGLSVLDNIHYLTIDTGHELTAGDALDERTVLDGQLHIRRMFGELHYSTKAKNKNCLRRWDNRRVVYCIDLYRKTIITGIAILL